MDVVNIKISKLGGLTRARQARDLCVSIGLAMTLEATTAEIGATTHAHPTLSEALFEAALDAEGRAIHF